MSPLVCVCMTQHSEVVFFSEVLPSCDRCTIQVVFVGKTKESLDVVEGEFIIGDIAPVFGPCQVHCCGS